MLRNSVPLLVGFYSSATHLLGIHFSRCLLFFSLTLLHRNFILNYYSNFVNILYVIISIFGSTYFANLASKCTKIPEITDGGWENLMLRHERGPPDRSNFRNFSTFTCGNPNEKAKKKKAY